MGSPFATATVPARVSGGSDVKATDGQLGYLRDLLTRKAQVKGMDIDAAMATAEPWMQTLSKSGASAQIDKARAWLQANTVPVTAADDTNGWVPADVVPEGRYAIDTADGATNATAFYKVDRPTEGRWAGYTFVKLLVSDEEQRLQVNQQKQVLRKIAAVGAAAASARYGHEIGECGVCSRQLTNDESRARGIGPVCAAKMGW